MLATVNPSKWSLLVKSYYHTLTNQLILYIMKRHICLWIVLFWRINALSIYLWTCRRLLFKLFTFSVVPFSLSRRHGGYIFSRNKSSQRYYRSPLRLPAAKWKLVDATWHWIYNKQPSRPMPMAMPGVDEQDYQRGTSNRRSILWSLSGICWSWAGILGG